MNKGTLGFALVFGLVSFAACSKAERDFSPGGTGGGGNGPGGECALGTHTCDPLVTCTDTEDGFTCGACPSGYDDINKDGSSCQDINECDIGVCDPQAPCMNTEGSFACGPCPGGLEDPNGDGTLCNSVCGSGVRAAGEGCDDGNTMSGDGCSDTCVIEGAFLQQFAAVSGLNGAWMTVSASGLIYIKDSGGGGGIDHIAVVNQMGKFAPNVIPGVLSSYGGDIVAFGEDLFFGGSTATPPAGTFGQRWTAASDSTATLYYEPITYYYGIAARDEKTFFIGGDKDIRAVETKDSSSLLAELNGNILYVNPASGKLLSADGPQLIQHDMGVSEILFAMTGGNIGDITADSDGRIYLTCTAPTDPPQACPSGSVWVVRPDGSEAKPIVDNFAVVRQIAWDPSTSDLVLYVGQGQLFRVNLKN